MKFLLMSLATIFITVPAFTEELSPTIDKGGEVFEINIGDNGQVQTIDYFYNFGRVFVGDHESVTFVLRNQSRIPIYVEDIDLTGEDFSKRERCPIILFRGDRCRVRVTFHPQEPIRHRGQLDFELSGHEDIRVHLRGRGVWEF